MRRLYHVEQLEGRRLLAFGVTATATSYVVDNGGDLKFSVLKGGTLSSTVHLGDVTSIQFKGQEMLAPYSTTSRYSHYEQGLGSATVITYTVDNADGWILLKCDDSVASDDSAIQYYAVRRNDNNLYMASLPTNVHGGPGEGRFIAYLERNVFANPEEPSDLAGNSGSIEGSDVYGFADGTTASKFYNVGGRRQVEHEYHGLVGSAGGQSVGAWMFMGSREHSAGGPFFKDIDFQAGSAVEIYNCIFTGHTQTEDYRQGLHTYAMQFTNGSAPVAPDYAWMDGLNLQGWIPASQRGTLTGVASGIAPGHEVTVGLANADAQYWDVADAGGNYAITGIQAGTYTQTLYDGELEVGRKTVTIAGGTTGTSNIVNTLYVPSNPVFRLGAWDGTPLGFMNADKIETMHPSDARMTPWNATANFVVGTHADAQFPMVLWRDGNNGQRITFNLTAGQVQNLTLRIGVTLGFEGGRADVDVNAGQTYAWSSTIPGASTDLNSRGITRGTWRGPNQFYTYGIPASALRAGSNTIDLWLVSGSAGSGFLSPNIVFDAIDLVPTTSASTPAIASVTVTPVNGSVAVNGTTSFTAVARDASGNVVPANFDWSAARGTIGPDGNYLAPATTGGDTITATATRTRTPGYSTSSSSTSAISSTLTGGGSAAVNVTAAAPRVTENLDRGVVATRSASNRVAVSWRLLATDPAGVGFNLYCTTNGVTTKVSGSTPLTGGTNFSHTNNSLAVANTYFVRPVVNGVEQPASASYTLAANAAINPYYTVPIKPLANYVIKHMNVADLNGDGRYDYVIGRKPVNVTNEVATEPSLVEAYLHDGTFLWTVNLGPGSYDVDNIEPGPTAIDVGNWDGVAVYDLDLDGKAEVFIRTANGVVFGNGATLAHPGSSDVQFLSAVDGMTGAERARIQLPTDYLADGPVAGMTAVGYLDGRRPSLVMKMKNRVGSGGFNEMIGAYDFDGTLTQRWVFHRGNQNLPDGHNIRIADVDQNGTDEVVEIGFVLNGDGTLRYSLGDQGIVHGDRFHIGDFDPARPGLEGYGVQQDNPSMLVEYFYDAATGQILHTRYHTSVTDNGRGDVGDVDPAYPGAEYSSFYGLHNSYNSVHTQISTASPWPHINIQWDGDLLTERVSTDSEVIDQWDPATQATGRVTTLYNMGSGAWGVDGGWPTYFGDVIGDWREEVIYEKGTRDGLVIFTTNIASSTRLYTLAQNPLYRNDMTTKGYLQSRHTDYFLGSGMSTPPAPNIAPLNFGSNAAPTLAAPASASPNPVTGTTVALSVLGADDGGAANLSYTWAGMGPAAVTFSANGSNAARNTTATFTAAGAYTFVATLRDAAGRTTTSAVNVTVNQAATGLTISPDPGYLNPNTTKQFTATATDQFGAALAASAFSWSVTSGGGTIDASGLYTAPATTGPATVRAAAGGAAATASVNVTTDALTNAWWKLDDNGGGTVVADSSGYARHGTAAGGPAAAAGKFGGALSFDGIDDSVALPNSIANTSAGSVSMWVKTGANFADAAHLFYFSPVTTGNGGGGENELHLNFLNNERLQFYIRGTAAGTDVNISSPSAYADNAWHHLAATWDVNGSATLYVDGVQVATVAHDAAVFTGSAVARLGRPATNTRYYSGLMDDVRLYDVAITASQVQALYGAGSTAPAWLAPGSAATWDAGTKTLTVTGAASIIADPGADAPLIVGNTAAAILTINPSTATQVNVGGITLSNGAKVTLTDAAAGRVLVVNGGGLSLSGGGRLDLTDNDMVVKGATLAAVRSLITAGYNGGTWDGGGVTSSTAAGDPNADTALGYADNAELGLSSFAGVALTEPAILVKYTYYGDADLTGVVDTDDFQLFLAGYQDSSLPRTWLYGEFDYSGVTDSDDFQVFLYGYQNQGLPL